MEKKKTLKHRISTILTSIVTVLMFTVSASASGTSGTAQNSATSVGNVLNQILGYLSSVTSGILDNELWLFGMGFFVLSFIAGFVMYLFRVGRR